MCHLRLSWKFPEGKGAALIFNKDAWALLQSAATKRGIAVEEMISVAVAELTGKIVRYHLND